MTPSSHALQRVHSALATEFDESAERPVTLFAPGRINLIGDHIDYVGGTVLPMSLDRGTWLAGRRARDGGLRVHAVDAVDAGETCVFPLDESPAGHWSRFVTGLLELSGVDARDLDVRIAVSGDLAGGGLSSSASFCVGMALLLMELDCIPRQRGMTLAQLARKVEHDHLGVACGIMDPATVVAGRSDAALELDCASGWMQPVPMDPPGRCILAIRARHDRRLADGAYNLRRRELAAGLARIGHADDRIPDLSPALLQDIAADDAPLRRVRHVVTEQRLVREALAAARRGDWTAFGAALTASHASLRDDYEVSVPDLDRIVDAATSTPGCEGARLTGAGFGGWAIALVRNEAVTNVLEAVAAARGDTAKHGPETSNLRGSFAAEEPVAKERSAPVGAASAANATRNAVFSLDPFATEVAPTILRSSFATASEVAPAGAEWFRARPGGPARVLAAAEVEAILAGADR